MGSCISLARLHFFAPFLHPTLLESRLQGFYSTVKRNEEDYIGMLQLFFSLLFDINATAILIPFAKSYSIFMSPDVNLPFYYKEKIPMILQNKS